MSLLLELSRNVNEKGGYVRIPALFYWAQYHINMRKHHIYMMSFSSISSFLVFVVPHFRQPAFLKQYPGFVLLILLGATYVYARTGPHLASANASASNTMLDDKRSDSFLKTEQLTPFCPLASLNLRHTNSAFASGDSNTIFSPGPTNKEGCRPSAYLYAE